MNDTMKMLDDNFEMYLLKKAPALPKGAKEAIVQFGPWITLVLLILALPGILLLFGVGTFLAPFAMMSGAGNGILYTVSMIVLFGSLVLEAMAIPGLMKRQMKAWRLMYYAVLLGAVSNLLQFNIIGLIISTVIGMYILFQIREYYK